MQLPSEILSNLNLEFSRFQQPELLDWRLEPGSWTASVGDRRFVIIHDEKLGYVIAEKKSASYSVGCELHRG
jgi:hypothetical protein